MPPIILFLFMGIIYFIGIDINSVWINNINKIIGSILVVFQILLYSASDLLSKKTNQQILNHLNALKILNDLQIER